MNKSSFLLILVTVSGCNFDTGSNTYTQAIGKSIPLECFKSNLKSVGGLDVGSETSNSIILIGQGVSSTIAFESTHSVVASYSVSTKTEKSKDGEIHKAIESAISRPCNS